MKNLEQWVLGILSVVLLIAVVVTIGISAGKTNPTNSEALLLSILLSVFSILAAVLVSHLYYKLSSKSSSDDAKRAYDEKIRTFALKAAEKVFNLSNEFDRLAENLRAALDENDEGETNKITVLLLKEKMSSAIHLLETLKSMNDTSLSDWKGIIGEDIQLQKQLQRQITEELEEQRELIARLETRVTEEGSEAVEGRLQQIERRLIEKVAALPFSFRPVQLRSKKQEMEIRCPGCQVSTTVKVRPRAGATKLFQCSGCKHFVLSKFTSESNFTVEMAVEKSISVPCDTCKAELKFIMPDALGATVNTVCPRCDYVTMATNSKEGVRHQAVRAGNLTDKFLDMVYSNIPPKPWPQGMHKMVAEKMGVSNSIVEKAIGALIKSGRLEPTVPHVTAVTIENGVPGTSARQG